jgi:hypothetical protein
MMNGTKAGMFISGAGPGGQPLPETDAKQPPPESPPTLMPGTKSAPAFSTFPMYGKDRPQPPANAPVSPPANPAPLDANR